MKVRIIYSQECEVEGKTIKEVQDKFEHMGDSDATFVEVLSATDESGNDIKDLLGY